MLNTFSEKANFIWSIADLIRDTFKRGRYQDVILPFTVLRRIDQVLEPTKDAVLETWAAYKERGEAPPDALLRRVSGYAFYNTSPHTFARLLADPPHLPDNLHAYIAGFSTNMCEVIEKFDVGTILDRLDEAGLLYMVMERFNAIDLHPDRVPNQEMSYIFEALIRKFNEALNENPGEHFTPREVVRLMVHLLLAPDQARLGRPDLDLKASDPCCGTGGMIITLKELVTAINPEADVHLFGQEVNPQTYAICKADLYMKNADGRDAESIAFGSTLSDDHHADQRFDYQVTNPPYGKDWKMDRAAVVQEAEHGDTGRFGAGLPRISDGQLLFLQHMLNRMKPAPEGGGRVAIVMNGSPLFTGDAGSGESEIRRWILENDWLEAIIALPEQLFYNTGIATYIWVLSNRKAPHRKGHVQLIDASDLWHPMRKSLGDKRREITDMHIAEIIRTYTAFEESARSKIFQTTDFGYRKVTIERPTRMNFCTCEERLPRLEGKRAFQNLAKHRQSAPQAQSPGRDKQRAILTLLRQMPPTLYKDVRTFRAALKRAANAQGVKLYAAMRDAIVDALGQPDENAEIMVDRQGRPIPNTALRDYERVPLNEDVDAYFVREIQSYVPDAWLNKDIIDAKDGGIGRVGYEINFGHHFYQYKPPRPLDAIVSDLQSLETDIMSLLGEVTGEQREDAGPKRWPPYPQYKRSGVPWLAEIPRHWEDKKLKFVAAINMGQSPSSKDYNHEGNGPPFLQGNAEFGAKHPTPTLYCHTANKRAAPGDLLLSVRAPVGALNVADQSYGIGRGLCAITPNDNALDKDYAWYLLQITRTELDTLATGSTYEAVSVDEVRNMLCLTPPLSEQRAIATYLDHETARLDTLAAKVQEVIERLSEYRTALIAAVVTGKMDVR